MGERLQGKVAVITGGTSGMGRGTVELFLQEGAKVVVADILDDKGAQMEKDFGPNLAYHHTNVAVEADVKGAVDLAVKKYGRLDCIFNNAGIGGVSGEIQEIDMDGFDKTMGVLVKGVVLGMKYAAPIMKAQKSGSIISTASVAGLSGGFGPHIYSAAKAAVVHLSKSVALELGKYNVRVNAICPGGIATSIFGRGLGLPSQLADESAKKMEEVQDYNANLKNFLYVAIFLSVIAFILLLVLVYSKCLDKALLDGEEFPPYCNNKVTMALIYKRKFELVSSKGGVNIYIL